MSTKIKDKTIVKSDTTENWAKAINFIPAKGEPIIYWDNTDIRMKIGDGITKVNALPFVFQRKDSSVVNDILVL